MGVRTAREWVLRTRARQGCSGSARPEGGTACPRTVGVFGVSDAREGYCVSAQLWAGAGRGAGGCDVKDKLLL
jgi:hypothetical protein